MPFSRSRSMESMTRSAMSAPSRKAPDCQSMASTSVVLPWSTWATIATLRRSVRRAIRLARVAAGRLALEAALFLDGALGERVRLEPVVGNRVAALDREAVFAVGEPLLRALERGELVAQLLAQALV